jgi:RHS repeat-associated protein
LSTLTYPISTSSFALTLQYGYGYGLLESVTDTSDTTATCGTTCALWTVNATNSFGEVTQETLGNGVVSNRAYDAVTSWLTLATAGVGGGTGIVNRSNLWDKNGNLIQRQANNLGITESFAYDSDNRLTCAALSSSCSSSTFVYDGGSAGPGNITSQTGVGTYTYPAAGQPRPHAVTGITGTFNGITNPSFAYDADGNMTDRASSGVNITWFSYNYPAVISATDVTGSEEVEFTYGPDRQRWEQIYSGPSGTEKTYYIGGLIDLVFNGSTTNYRQYIYAGSEPVAFYSRTSAGTNTINYVTGDFQGSVSTIRSNAGVGGINESFTAFGSRRNPNTWSGAPAASDLTTIAGISRQGYTFQTALGQSMGLNHMNGRVQDAILGRFLSPDIHIPDPTNAQSYNRYSYVNNNPLTMIDPTGFCGLSFDFDPGSDGGFIDNGDGTFDSIPVVGSSITVSGDLSDCFSVPNIGAGLGAAPKLPPIAPPLPSALDQFNVCMANASSSGANSPSPNSQGMETANNVADSAAAIDAFTGGLASSTPSTLGQVFSPSAVPGAGVNVAPTNGTVMQFGEGASEFFQTAAPYVRTFGYGAAFFAGTASAYQGYQSGGVPGAASAAGYAAADFAVDTALVTTLDPLIGVPASIAYNKAGGTRAFTNAAMLYSANYACAAATGTPIIGN